ncbi:MAG: SPOR domain-containing protein [bacterium]
MRNFPILFTLILVGLGCLLSSCMTTEEAGKSLPVASSLQAKIDSARIAAVADSLARTDSIRSRKLGFDARQDTISVSTTTKSKKPPRKIKPLQKPANAAYTVQVGAFSRTQFALRTQQLAKERYPDQTVFNDFEPYDKLYRVRVGKFVSRTAADSLRRIMKSTYPAEYTECWINYIAQ